MSIAARRFQAASHSSGGASQTLSSPSKLLVVMEENHSLSEMESGMPYLYSLAQKYAYATNYTAITHPSLPNYIAIAGGSTFGITDDNDPSSDASMVGTAQSVFDQALAAGKTAKVYCQSMISNCELTNDGNYAVRHNPWAYFSSGSSNANIYDVPMATNFANDVAANTLPNAGMLIPDVMNDAHDGTLAQADAFLQSNLPSVLASSDFTSGKLVVVITADEDDSTAGNTVLTVVLHASLSGKVVSTPLTHYSLTAYYAYITGTTPLLNGSSAPSFSSAFGLTSGGGATSWSDNFDEGNLNNWIVNQAGAGTVTLSAAAAESGAYGVIGNVPAATTDVANLERVLTPTTAATISGWWKVTTEGASGSNVPFCRFFNGTQRLADVYRQNITGEVWLRVVTSAGGRNYTYIDSKFNLALNTWVNVTFGWNLNGTPKLIINGTQYLGAANVQTDYYLATQIDTLYVGSQEPGNQGVWNMDELTVTLGS